MLVSQRCALSTLTLALGFFAQTAAQAVLLTEPISPAPFADTELVGTTAALRPELAGTVVEDVLTPFSFSGITGTVQNRVVRETGSGTLDFYWKVNVDASSTGGRVGAFRLADFGYANLKDADWRIDGLGIEAPTTGRLFNVAGNPGGDINFLLDSAVPGGGASRFFFLHTDATQYALTAKYDMLTGGSQQISGIYSTFAPAVPEPSSYALTAMGMAVVAVYLRRRRT